MEEEYKKDKMFKFRSENDGQDRIPFVPIPCLSSPSALTSWLFSHYAHGLHSLLSLPKEERKLVN